MGARVSDLIQSYLPAGFTVTDLIGALAGMSMLITVFALWNAVRGNTGLERRIAQVAQRKEALRQVAIATRSHRERLTAAGLMTEAVKRLNLLRSNHATEARMMLARAGMRSREATIRYLFARICLPLAFAMLVLMDSYGLHLLMVPKNFVFMAAGIAAVLGYFAPGIYLKNLATKRGQKLQLGLPDALDLMVICAEAGLSLDAALVRVSRELEPTWPDLAEELAITAAELTFLPDRRLAFENLNQRTNMPSIRGVVNTLLQTAKFGTPLAQSLRVLAAEFRDARMFKAEEKAARLPALMTVPMIIFILPTLFIVLLGPAALSVVDTFSGKPKAEPRTVTVTNKTGADDGSNGAADQPDEVVEKSAPAPSNEGGQTPSEAPPAASIEPPSGILAGQPFTVLVDARPFATGFDHRVILVPVGTSESTSDQKNFAASATPISAAQVQVTLRAPKAGEYEVRLYYIPHYSRTYTVASRTQITVAPAP